MSDYKIDPENFFIPFEENKQKYIELEHLAKHIKVKYVFPAWWVFKVIGVNNEKFGEKIIDFLTNKKLKDRPMYKFSKNKKYISYTFEIYVTSKNELDKIYNEIKQIKEVKFAL